MEYKTIKISKENYLWLLKIAADIQKDSEKMVTFDSALSKLKKKALVCKEGSILDLAGRWKMSHKESKKFLKDSRKGWKKWKIESV